MSKLPWHWPIMKQVLHKHLALFLVLSILGGSFTIVGIFGIAYAESLPNRIAAFFALIPGLFVLGFNVVSNFSSCMYYYEQSLLKKYGTSITATVISKMIDGATNTMNHMPKTAAEETNLSIQYQFSYLRQPYEGESFINSIELFNSIEIGMEVPIIAMKKRPKITRLQSIKLKRKLNLTKKKTSEGAENQPNISQSLIDD